MPDIIEREKRQSFARAKPVDARAFEAHFVLHSGYRLLLAARAHTVLRKGGGE